ncbi:MAG: hypothetical protein WA642_04095 [Steroidobacteraceae bacterium]
MADGAAVAAAFKYGTQIRIVNSFHVNALPHARSACAVSWQPWKPVIPRVRPGSPPLRLVPRFALHAAELDPAAALPGNRSGSVLLRWISAAVLTAGDVLARLDGNSTGQGVGLRGGTFRVAKDATVIHVSLDHVRWVEDLAVSGTLDKAAPCGP